VQQKPTPRPSDRCRRIECSSYGPFDSDQRSFKTDVNFSNTLLHHQSSIRVIRGNPDDPHLPKGGVDAVLIANSYHEFTKPPAILDHAFRALRSDGRLVVLDRGPRSYHGEPREIQMQQYQIASSIAEDEIRQRGFEVISRDDRFIDRPATERPGDRPDDHV
jgi:SAM-dependent methyltransferase